MYFSTCQIIYRIKQIFIIAGLTWKQMLLLVRLQKLTLWHHERWHLLHCEGDPVHNTCVWRVSDLYGDQLLIDPLAV